MKSFNVTHMLPNSKASGFRGLHEIILSVIWGLRELGYTVKYSVNTISHDDTNIVFGAQIIQRDHLWTLPDDTIIYNFEQKRLIATEGADNGSAPASLDVFPAYAIKYAIWDFSQANLDYWKRVPTRFPVRHVPVGYAPVLSRIAPAEEEDIDVLIYGHAGPERLGVFGELSERDMSVVFVSGLYGAARDALIARSKIVLNVHISGSKIFEIARVSYLLANRKAVVAGVSAETFVEPDILPGVKFCPVDRIADECERLLADDAARAGLGESGYQLFQRRDIRPILEEALRQ